jgi:hypothetical protein
MQVQIETVSAEKIDQSSWVGISEAVLLRMHCFSLSGHAFWACILS